MAPRTLLILVTSLLAATLTDHQPLLAQGYGYNSNPYSYQSQRYAFQSPTYPQAAELPTPAGLPMGDYEHEIGPTPAMPSTPVTGTPCSPSPNWNCGSCDSCAGCCNQCNTPVCFQPCNCCRWYGSVAGLYLDRSEPTRIWTTYENNNNPNQLMNTQDADTDWEGGAEFRLGRYFCCNRWALELGYWSIGNFDGYSSMTHPSYVSSPLLFNDLEFAVGDPVSDYFDSAEEHRLSRSNELHNVEVNLIQGGFPCGCNRWSAQMLAGFRFFRFDEDLTFDTLDQGGTWGGSGGADEVRLSESVSNSLIGAQVGCVLQRQLGCRCCAIITPKFGVYNNHIENFFDLRRGDGTAAMPSAFSGVSGSYPVRSEDDEIAFLSELNAGLQHRITRRCTLVGGYRVVVLTNLALADEQIPQYIVDIPEIADINTTGSLILHGAYFGATWCF